MKNFKNYFLLALLSLAIVACNDDEPMIDTPEDDTVTAFTSGEVAYTNGLKQIDSLATNLNIDTFYVDADYLYLVTHYSGGCEDHEFEFIWDADENATRYNILIVHDNKGDGCEALITDTLVLAKDHFDLSSKVLEFIYAPGSKLTLSFGAEIPSSSDITIKTGSSFGECIETCIRELIINKNNNHNTEGTWANETTLIATRTTRSDEWDELTNSFNETAFFGLDTIYGCPDCVDGGAEWIEVTTSNGTHKVTFEYGDTLSDISNFHTQLMTFQESL